MQYQYTIHSDEQVYDGFFKFYHYRVSFEKFEGGFLENVSRECGKKGDIVGVLPYDPKTQEFLLVEQFRIGMAIRESHPWTQEIVAGFMDVPGESPADTAKRELTEETGCTAIDIFPLLDFYPSPGGSAAKNHLFIATVNADEALEYTGLLEESEDIRVLRVGIDTLREQLNNGQINNATAIIAFQQFFMNEWDKKLS